mgnify:FL=1|jgi:dephospho-CoA kinase
MKITVKHRGTEVVIEDEEFDQKDNRALIYNNQTYLLTLLEKISEQIIKLQTQEIEKL